MSSEQEINLKQLQVDVENAIANDNHNKIAKICRTVLLSKPRSVQWLRLLCCAMIHLSQTKQLLKLIDSHLDNDRLCNALLFYKIYALYLLKQNENAQQLISQNRHAIDTKLSNEERLAVQFLTFQIAYRLGQYESALSALSQIKDSEHLNETIVNKISTLIAMNESKRAIAEYFDGNKQQNEALRTNSDFLFNLSTALILNSRINEAKKLLLSSLSLVIFLALFD